MQLAEQLLGQLVAALSAPDDGMADNAPGHPPGAGGGRLEGKLKLALALVQTLDRRSIGACSDRGLVTKLLSGALVLVTPSAFSNRSPKGDYVLLVECSSRCNNWAPSDWVCRVSAPWTQCKDI